MDIEVRMTGANAGTKLWYTLVQVDTADEHKCTGYVSSDAVPTARTHHKLALAHCSYEHVFLFHSIVRVC